MIEQVPQKLNPVRSLVGVGAQRTEVIPTIEEATAAMRRMGCKIGENELEDLATIGARVQELGVLQEVRGTTLADKQMLTDTIQVLKGTVAELQEKPNKTRADLASITKLSRSIRYLSAQLKDVRQLLAEIERLPRQQDLGAGAPLEAP